ncbi:SlyX family protein [Magnetospira sp. QH-2]|uniref:SlyX family protein n=1 Tax=Magnetospira sp. (strain QH-2) TaxID=1288970 RepID=UPI0003E814CF|nr:SlyX family protein [Magnetospira sp. QH-2]CCQ74392.1 putative Protein slyX homolog [Magnetospira sp. QH-2]
MTNDSERLVELEMRLVEQERLTQDLSDMVAEQWKVIDALRLVTDRLKDRVIAAEDRLDVSAPPAHDPPPHY